VGPGLITLLGALIHLVGEILPVAETFFTFE
jgi:hypothetical protein